MKKQISFRDELRKSLIIHAFTPCLILIIVSVMVSFSAFMFMISDYNRKTVEETSREFEKVFEDYREETVRQSEHVSIEKFQNDINYRVKAISEIYQFLNAQKIRGEYYLFDPQLSCIYTTQNSKNLRDVIVEQIQGKRKSILEDKKEFIYVYESHDSNEAAVSAYMILMPVYENDRLKGIDGFIIHLNQIEKYILSSNNDYIVINPFNRVLMSSDGSFSDSRGKLNEKIRGNDGLQKLGKSYYFFAVKKINNPEMQLYSYTDCTAWFEIIILVLFVTFLASLILILAISKSTKRFADQKTKIIYELIDALEQVEKGNLDVTLDIQSNDEFQFIGSSFNMMIGSIRHLIERHQEMAREQVMAHIQVMESQFNPHFLFNTLESIRYMILFDQKSAQEMVVNLSKLLRYSIKCESETVKLQQELNFVWNYAKIMLARYGKKLSVEIKTGEGTEELVIPRMILQPLIENAIKYGYADSVDVLKILVESYVENNNLWIIIRDNGVGIDPKLLKNLQDNLKKKYNTSDHIGLYNVYRRIFLLYGKEYGLFLESEQMKGTTIRLKLPVIAAEINRKGNASC